ncbi:amidase [Thalassobacillus cyri]|uniref:Amidase n=1 Tax=Thalassobacillus cyri TaxID=571932 RepID=A0A1H3W6B4_9BACI|nr:amidase [Thalassobacillus cyri]SDZ82669.1 amidase [Thalassobacillus cyri]
MKKLHAVVITFILAFAAILIGGNSSLAPPENASGHTKVLEHKNFPYQGMDLRERLEDGKELTVAELTRGYKNGVFRVTDVVQAHLERIEQYEDTYNAFTFINDHAMQEASEMDARIKKEDSPGKLAGVPIVLKETVDVTGFPSTFGWEGFHKEAGGVEIMPQVDAPIVEKLKAEGAIILGKTNMPAFSISATNANTSWAGKTLNVINPAFAPGGSSSGTATAVSGNLAVLGIAAETGGSIQNPAASQALVGVKPTFGLVPNSGAAPFAASTRDVLGPHSRTVQDAAIMLDVIAGNHPDDPKTEAASGKLPEEGYTGNLTEGALEGKRIGLYGPGWRGEALSAETQQLYDRAVKELEAQGAEVVTDPFAGSGFASFVEATGNIGYDAFVSDIQSYLDRMDPEETIPSLPELFKQMETAPWAAGEPLQNFNKANLKAKLKAPDQAPDLSYFFDARANFQEIIRGVMDKHNLDAFVYPQMAAEIPPLTEGIHQPTASPEVNISGQPLVTVPAGYYQSGKPFSLAFFGKMWSEAELLGMAYDYEQATQYRKVPVLEADAAPTGN